jgi:hypothetical protein
VDGEGVLVDKERGFVHQLNRTACFIWSCFDGRAETADIAAQVAETFDVDADAAARDVQALVGELTALELLVPGNGENHGGDDARTQAG